MIDYLDKEIAVEKLKLSKNDIMEQELLDSLDEYSQDWLHCGTLVYDFDTIEEAIEYHANHKGECLECLVQIHLKDGRTIKLHGNYFDCYTQCDENLYDFALVSDKKTFTSSDCIQYGNYLPIFRVLIHRNTSINHVCDVPISSVSYIEMEHIEVDWRKLWADLSPEERERRKELYRKKKKEQEENNK